MQIQTSDTVVQNSGVVGDAGCPRLLHPDSECNPETQVSNSGCSQVSNSGCSPLSKLRKSFGGRDYMHSQQLVQR